MNKKELRGEIARLEGLLGEYETPIIEGAMYKFYDRVEDGSYQNRLLEYCRGEELSYINNFYSAYRHAELVIGQWVHHGKKKEAPPITGWVIIDAGGGPSSTGYTQLQANDVFWATTEWYCVLEEQ